MKKFYTLITLLAILLIATMAGAIEVYTDIYTFGSTDIYNVYDEIDDGTFETTEYFTPEEALSGNGTALLFILNIPEESQTEDLQIVISYTYNEQEHEYYNGDPSYLLENHGSSLWLFTAPSFTLDTSLLENITMRAYYGEQEAEATMKLEESEEEPPTEDPEEPGDLFRITPEMYQHFLNHHPNSNPTSYHHRQCCKRHNKCPAQNGKGQTRACGNCHN